MIDFWRGANPCEPKHYLMQMANRRMADMKERQISSRLPDCGWCYLEVGRGRRGGEGGGGGGGWGGLVGVVGGAGGSPPLKFIEPRKVYKPQLPHSFLNNTVTLCYLRFMHGRL